MRVCVQENNVKVLEYVLCILYYVYTGVLWLCGCIYQRVWH